MSKDKTQLLSPLFLKYQTDYEKNPRSRVFAPLAEIYRKVGMTDKAMEILAQGIRFHPTYVMGYLGLAACYFDLKQYNLAYSTLRPLAESNRDNIRLQKLFADVCLELNYKEEALDTYKYLLFINPRDKEVALRVTSLEKQIDEQYKPIHKPIFISDPELSKKIVENHTDDNLFDIEKLENRPIATQSDFDDWMALDLSRDKKLLTAEDPYEFWSLKKGELIQPKVPQNELAPTADLEKIHRLDYVELNFDEEQPTKEEANQETPLVTHTLVDLYCGQGHIEKALEVLEKILILNPGDKKTLNKIAEIKALLAPVESEVVNTKILDEVARPVFEELKETSEEDGRKNLMNIFDQKVASIHSEQPLVVIASSKMRQVEEKLARFLEKIQKRALDYQSRV